MPTAGCSSQVDKLQQLDVQRNCGRRKGCLKRVALNFRFLQRLALELRKRGVMVADPENLENWRSLICESN